MTYDALVIAAHPDDAETQMGGTRAKLSDAGQHILLVDLTDGEPTEFAEPGVRAEQAARAARILGVERTTLGLRDRLLADTTDARLRVAGLIRRERGATEPPILAEKHHAAPSAFTPESLRVPTGRRGQPVRTYHAGGPHGHGRRVGPTPSGPRI